MRTVGIAVALGLLLGGGATLAQRAKTASTGLSADAQKLETSYGQALESARGRMTKADWAKRVGTTDAEYQKAATHMPRGLAVAQELKDAARAAKARSKSSTYAGDEALRRLRAGGSTQPSRADADRWVQAQDQQLAAVNASLANRSAEVRQLSEKGDRDGVAKLVGQVGVDGAKGLAKGAVNGAPETRSQADQQKSLEQYVRLMNKVAKRRGGK